MSVEIKERTYRFKQPFVTATGRVCERKTYELTLTDSEGHSGVGEAAPLPHYDGVSYERTEAALNSYKQLLSESDLDLYKDDLLASCKLIDPLPQALAAVDLALWSLRSSRKGRSLVDLLWQEYHGLEPLDSKALAVELNWAIATDSIGAAVESAERAVAAGYKTLKIKADRNIETTLQLVRYVSEAVGPKVKLRIDANGVWSVVEALKLLTKLDGLPVEFVEEPGSGYTDLKSLTGNSGLPVAIDESWQDVEDPPGGLTADYAVLKLSRFGGVTGLFKAAKLARERGLKLVVASTLDGEVGIRAALAATAVIKPDAACGLATLELFEGDFDGRLLPVNGQVDVAQLEKPS